MIIPTLVDPSMAPPGKHVISCFVQYAPYKLAPELGTWDDQREAFGDAVIDRIAEFAPNIRDIILHRNVQTPLDIERTTGLSEGNIFQGELSLEQLFFNRPVPGYARSRRRSATCGCAGRRPTRAAGSWARTAGLRRSRSYGPAAGRRP
jgi:phytoene dehydrogenase-like protein